MRSGTTTASSSSHIPAVVPQDSRNRTTTVGETVSNKLYGASRVQHHLYSRAAPLQHVTTNVKGTVDEGLTVGSASSRRYAKAFVGKPLHTRIPFKT